MKYWSPEELAAMDVVKFETTDAKGKKVPFETPKGAKLVCKPRPMTWQEQMGLGMSGAVTRFVGIGLATATLTLSLYTPEHRAQFEAGCGKYLVSPPQGQPAKVYTAYHPRLARLKISQVRLLSDPAGEWDEGRQVETVVYELGEWRKPLPMLSSAPTTAGAGKDGSKAKSATTEALKKRIADNSAQIDALGKELAK